MGNGAMAIGPQATAPILDSTKKDIANSIPNGSGASKLARVITMNIGTMAAGPKVNMIASRCEFEVDIRIPNGVTKTDVLDHLENLRARHDFNYEVLMSNDSNRFEPIVSLLKSFSATLGTSPGSSRSMSSGLVTPTHVSGVTVEYRPSSMALRRAEWAAPTKMFQ